MIFKIGMRTIKTTISIALCALVMKYIFQVPPFFACIGALVAINNTIINSLKGIVERNLATLIGGLIGMIFSYISSNVLFLSLGIMVVIIILNKINYSEVIVVACIVYLAVVYLNENQEAVVYASRRIFETLIGSLIGLVVNVVIVAPEDKEKAN